MVSGSFYNKYAKSKLQGCRNTQLSTRLQLIFFQALLSSQDVANGSNAVSKAAPGDKGCLFLFVC